MVGYTALNKTPLFDENCNFKVRKVTIMSSNLRLAAPKMRLKRIWVRLRFEL